MPPIFFLKDRLGVYMTVRNKITSDHPELCLAHNDNLDDFISMGTCTAACKLCNWAFHQYFGDLYDLAAWGTFV